MEKFETPRERAIRVRAHIDARKYISLMRQVSPESLELQPNGEIIINTIHGEAIFNDAKQSLSLTIEEMVAYMISLADVVKSSLAN